MGKLLQIVVVVLFAAVISQVTRTCTQGLFRPSQSDLSDDEINDIIPGWNLLALDERETFREIFERPDVRTEADAFDLMQDLTAAGLLRLSDEELLARTELLGKSLERVSAETCGRVGGGTAVGLDRSDIEELLDQLGQDEVMAFHVLSLRAGVYQWRGAPPRVELTEQQIDMAFDIIEDRLTSEEIDRFWNVLMDAARASLDDLCWVARRLYNTAVALPEPENALVARLLVTP